jgi:hypothetical protein
LESIFSFFQDSNLSNGDLIKEAKKIGFSSSPHFVIALYEVFKKNGQEERFHKEILPHMKADVDNLHNIRGWFIRLILELIENGRLDETMLNNRLQ